MPTSTSPTKKILFVDDNPQFLEIVKELMDKWSEGEWQIFVAQNAGKALLLLQEQPMDLAVVDVQMPVVDGIQFLSLLSRKYPTVQKVSLSGNADESCRTACLRQGAELFLEKPRARADFEIIFSTLRELTRVKSFNTGFFGLLRHVSLQDIIQMECLNRNTSLLEISAAKGEGKIFIDEGRIIHAECGERSGEDAFNYILGLKGGEFNIRPYYEPSRQTIDSSWESLVMEAARAKDEAAASKIKMTPSQSN